MAVQSAFPFGLSPSSTFIANPFGASGWQAQSPFHSVPPTYASYASQPVQQILQLLQIVPQHLYQLQQLEYLQQQQLQQLQQIVQLIPAQLAQLQYQGQFGPQQLQQTQQPFGQVAGAAGVPMVSPWGLSPQVFGGQPTYVM